jgi:hypothetical protein
MLAKGKRFHGHFLFNLRDGGAGVPDSEGVELPDIEAAKAYATEVARELMKCHELQKRDWRLDVRSGDGELLFDLPFATVDPTLDHLMPDLRRVIERLCENKLRLSETVFSTRALTLYLRAARARTQRKPYLAARFGQRLDTAPPSM